MTALFSDRVRCWAIRQMMTISILNDIKAPTCVGALIHCILRYVTLEHFVNKLHQNWINPMVAHIGIAADIVDAIVECAFG